MKYYCIGIKGAGMSTLANCLKDLGHEVSGYDDHHEYKYTQEGLKQRNIKIYYQGPILDRDTIVTYSKAFSLDHPELKRVKELGYTIIDYNEVVAEITKQFKTICVNGTHGKTTVSLMLAQILNSNYFVGDGSAKITKDCDYFVIESDEYNKHFLAYYPYISLTNNIEFDHGECYLNGLDEIIETFETFNNKAQISVINGDDINIAKINFTNKVIRFGLNPTNDVYAKNYIFNQDGFSFDCYINQKFFYHFKLNLYGTYMLYNVLAAIGVASYLNIDALKIETALKNFKGAKRRFKETLVNDCIIIDDYAHHPSEIKSVIEAIKQKYNDKKLITVFMPNTYSRTKDLLKEFKEAFKNSDYTYITPILCDRENPLDYPNISSELIIENNPNMEILTLENINKLLTYKDSVIAFLSCADIKPYINEYTGLKLQNN